jgi:DNA-binding NtrC family response regulator
MSQTSVLLVDDEDAALEALAFAVPEGTTALKAHSAEEAVEILKRRAVAAVLCDLNMPGGGGKELLRTVKARWPGTEVAVVTADAGLGSAVECMRLGAVDYVTKPWDLNVLRPALRRWIEQGERKQRQFTQGLSMPLPGSELVGSSALIGELRVRVRRAAEHDSAFLLQGPAGSGKSLAAACVHRLSPRRTGPWVVVDCARLMADEALAALFGLEQEAAGAVSFASPGAFDRADGGTLLLKNVEALSLDAQSGLLTALQNREVRRVGSGRRRLVDVRVLSTTRADLSVLVEQGSFLKSLYWRIVGTPLRVPALDERGGDKLELATYFLQGLAARENRLAPGLDPRLAKRILERSYPGNVEELEDCIRHLYGLSVTGAVCLEPAGHPWVADPEQAFQRALDFFDSHALAWSQGRPALE